MDPDRWQRIETIFAGGVELPPAEREAYLAARCGDDVALAAEVRALLVADQKAASLLDGPALGGATAAAAADPMLGHLFDGRYRTLSVLGRGGMGAVYEAVHTGTSRRVAVKVIAPNVVASRALLRRFQLEARAAGRLESPHVAQVLDVGIDEASRSPYLAIELLRGSDVAELVKRLGALDPTLALRIIAQACRGLEEAHAHGIIHRDIKPANLFLAKGPDDSRVVKILDFGIAKLQDEELSTASAITKTGTILGSPLYMSPEQSLGETKVDHRTDIWSLGVALFELLTGTTPFDRAGTLASLLVAISTAPVPLVRDRAPWVTAEVATLVEAMLQRDRARRYQSATELSAALRSLLPGGVAIRETELVARAHAGAMPTTASVASGAGPTPAAGSTIPLIEPTPLSGADQTGVSAATVSETARVRGRAARGRWLVAGVVGLGGVVLVGGLMKTSGGDDGQPVAGSSTAEPLVLSASATHAQPGASTSDRSAMSDGSSTPMTEPSLAVESPLEPPRSSTAATAPALPHKATPKPSTRPTAATTASSKPPAPKPSNDPLSKP